jgi:hypothetical protein
MPSIAPILKPEIFLIGKTIEDGAESNFADSIDHSVNSSTFVTNEIRSETTLNKANILTFQESVRIIVTGMQNPKPSYVKPTKVFASTEFEGRANPLSPGVVGIISPVAETYYTLNGEDPRRHKINLYNYLDRDDETQEITRLIARNPSILNPSVPDEGYLTTSEGNLSDLGFVLGPSPTGNDLIILKARTFYDGKVSPTAMAVFKVAQRQEARTIVNPTN